MPKGGRDVPIRVVLTANHFFLQCTQEHAMDEAMNRMTTYKFFSMMILALLAFGCSPAKKKETVWSQYDVRHPVPVDSKVPVSQASQYDKYIDNDAYYVPPGVYQDRD